MTPLAATGEAAKSGPWGLAIILIFCVACYFLFKSMSKHLRKVREEFPVDGPADRPAASPSATSSVPTAASVSTTSSASTSGDVDADGDGAADPSADAGRPAAAPAETDPTLAAPGDADRPASPS